MNIDKLNSLSIPNSYDAGNKKKDGLTKDKKKKESFEKEKERKKKRFNTDDSDNCKLDTYI